MRTMISIKKKYYVVYSYACINHNDTIIKTSDTVLKKIYLSLYLKGLCVRGSWEPNRTTTYWLPTLLAITTFLSRSPELLNRGPGGPASLGHVPQSSIFSPTHLIPNSQSGAWGLPLLGAGFLYRILSPTGLVSKLIEFPVHSVI